MVPYRLPCCVNPSCQGTDYCKLLNMCGSCLPLSLPRTDSHSSGGNQMLCHNLKYTLRCYGYSNRYNSDSLEIIVSCFFFKQERAALFLYTVHPFVTLCSGSIGMVIFYNSFLKFHGKKINVISKSYVIMRYVIIRCVIKGQHCICFSPESEFTVLGGEGGVCGQNICYHVIF